MFNQWKTWHDRERSYKDVPAIEYWNSARSLIKSRNVREARKSGLISEQTNSNDRVTMALDYSKIKRRFWKKAQSWHWPSTQNFFRRSRKSWRKKGNRRIYKRVGRKRKIGRYEPNKIIFWVSQTILAASYIGLVDNQSAA